MKKIILLAESGSDITPEQAAQYGIELVPMHVSMGDVTLDDGTFPPKDVFRFYETNRILPKTSGSTEHDFSVVFDRIHEAEPDAHILHLAYSAVTTVSYSAAKMAAENRDYVTSIDTKHVSAGQSIIVRRVAQYLRENPDSELDQVIAYAEKVSTGTHMGFIPDTLEYLHAGGRCSNFAKIGGFLLKLHPLIDVIDGTLTATKKYRGSFQKIIPGFIRDYADTYDLDREKLTLVYAPGFSDENRELVVQSAKKIGFQEIEQIHTGCVIATHGGPGSFGIAGFSKGLK